MIVLCRHGSTDENVAGGFLSTNDPPLNALGRTQSERLRDALCGVAFDVAFVSPMRRCIETCTIVAPSVASCVEDALREIEFGAWEGRTIAWLERHDPEGVARRRVDPVAFRPANGESFVDVSRRLRPFVERLRESNPKAALIVGHRGTLGTLERMLRNLPLASRDVQPLDPGEHHVLP